MTTELHKVDQESASQGQTTEDLIIAGSCPNGVGEVQTTDATAGPSIGQVKKGQVRVVGRPSSETTETVDMEHSQRIDCQVQDSSASGGDGYAVGYNTEDRQVGTITTSTGSDDVSAQSKKRQYTYKTRQPASRSGPSQKKIRFMTHADLNADAYKTKTCCKRKQCFRHVNLVHLVNTAKRLMTMSNMERRDVLMTFLSDGNVFMFDGRPVCAEFLVKAFRFSRDLQGVVKQTTGSHGHRREVLNYSGTVKTQSRDSIVVFLRRIAAQTGNTMPDTDQVHLPFYDKAEVYRVFCDQFRALEKMDPPKLPYFYAVWKEYAGHVKVRTVTRFAKCSVCETFKDAMQRAARTAENMSLLQKDRKAHYDFIATERQAYKMNQDNACLNPSEYMSLAIDGADQSAFGLPHFVTVTKDTRGHSLKVKLIGILQHGPMKNVGLYTMTENHETGGNHVIECIHRYLNMCNDRQGLPNILYVQLDNCTRENKNRYLLGYLECLVLWGVFQEVYASFLPVGHTHIDIDQVFSRTATRLHANTAVTLKDLHNELSQSYMPVPTVNHVAKVANISGLFETNKCIWSGRDTRLGPLHYFRFSRSPVGQSSSSRSARYATMCHVKKKSMDSWEKLRPDAGTTGFTGFLTSEPDLRKTPPTKLRCPPNKDEVMKRLHSEEIRVGSRQKMDELQGLIRDVYEDRMDKFHWDLKNSVESNVVRSQEKGVLEDDVLFTGPGTAGQMQYALNSFVAIRPAEATDRVPFWVGRIVKVSRTKEKEVTGLTVQWFETAIGKDVYDAVYKPTNKYPHKPGFSPWNSKICIESVMVTFSGLTTKGSLSAEVCKQIQASVSSYAMNNV